MSKQLQKLIVSLEAESSKLTSQLEKSNKRLQRWENKAGKSVDRVKHAFVALASVASVAVFAKLTKDAIEFADNIGKVSDAVGLATDTYQSYVHAASLAGIEQSQLNSNLTAFVKRVGEAREGVGPLISFLKKYDETLLKNIQSSKNQEHAFELVADAIQNATNATDRAAIANAAFSRAGVAMTLMMRNGASGLREMKREAYDLGIILDEQTIRKAEEANDKLDIMARVIKTNVIKQLVKLSPQIIKVGNAFANAIPKVTAFFERVFDRSSVPALEKELASLRREAVRVSDKLKEATDTSLFEQATSGSLFSLAFGDSPKELNVKLDNIKAKISETVEAIKKKKEEVATQAAALELGLTGKSGDSGERLQAELDTMTEQAGKKLFILDEYLLAESERLTLAYENRQLIIEDAFQNELINDQRKNALLEKLELDHQKKLNDIKYKGLSVSDKFATAFRNKDLKNAFAYGAELTAAGARTNKNLFDANKAFAIADSVMKLPHAVMSSFEKAGGWPWGVVPAGLTLATGLSQINAIRSASFSGGGSAPSLIGAGGGASTITATQPTTDVFEPEAVDREPQKVVNISISGNPTGEQVRDLIEAINEEQGNGAVLKATVAA